MRGLLFKTTVLFYLILTTFKFILEVETMFIDIFRDIFSSRRKHGNEVVIYFVGNVNHFEHHSMEHFVQQVLLPANHSVTLRTWESVHIQSIKVAITSVSRQIRNRENAMTIYKLTMTTDTLVFFVETINDFKSYAEKCIFDLIKSEICRNYQTLISTPSFKILLLYSNSGDLLNSHAICNSFCLSIDPKINLTRIKYSRTEILQRHKRYLFNANKKQLQAYIPYTKDNFQIQFEDLTCDMIFNKRKYAELDQLYHCWAKQMLAYELAKLHNVTYIKTGNSTDHSFLSFMSILKTLW